MPDPSARAPRRDRRRPRAALAGLLLAVGLGLGGPVAIAAAQDAPAAATAATGTAALRVDLRLAEFAGAVAVVGPDGASVPAEAGLALAEGTTIETGEDGQVVVSAKPLYPGSSVDPEVAPGDAVVLGPGSRITLGRIDPEPRPGTASLRMQVLVEVERGDLRVRTGLGGNYPCLAVRTGDRTIRLRGADLLLRHDPAADEGDVAVLEGMAVIEAGRRRIRVPDGMVRRVMEGRIRGAGAIEDDERTARLDRLPLRGIAGADERIAAEVPLGTGRVAYVELETTDGEIVIELDLDRAPISGANFLQYVDEGFYAGTIFHRVVTRGIFVVQGGGLTRDLTRKPTRDPIVNEWDNGLEHEARTVAMARAREADSATSQFYFNVRANPVLDRPRDGAAYAVFGRVVAGWDVVTAIAGVPTGVRGGRGDVPMRDIIIERARRLEREDLRGPDEE